MEYDSKRDTHSHQNPTEPNQVNVREMTTTMRDTWK